MAGERDHEDWAVLDGAARAEFRELTAGLGDGETWHTTVAAFGEYLNEPEAWAEIAARVGAALEEGRPASFIRLGDGEGNLLALSLGDYPKLAERCIAADSRLHLGQPELLGRAAAEVIPELHAALRNADLVGFPGPYGIAILLGRSPVEAYVRPIQGLASVHHYLERFAGELRLAAKTGAPAGFHRGLLEHYASLISGREIGIVTCHEALAEGLEKRMGASSVDLRPVPPQALIASAPDADTGHWPGRYRELVEELGAIEPGRLWFVAAGIFGKVYCEKIRAAGGVALDIGHTADVWAGVRSRESIKPQALERWSVV